MLHKSTSRHNFGHLTIICRLTFDLSGKMIIVLSPVAFFGQMCAIVIIYDVAGNNCQQLQRVLPFQRFFEALIS